MGEYEDKMMESEHNAVISEWRRDKYEKKEKAEAAEKGFAAFIKEALKNPANKKNLGAEGLRSMKAGQRGEDPVAEAKAGFGGEITEADFTGINEDRPWERE